ncbi:uncharacterized protein LOC123695211 [Colias croceus]|uniref:uncharacterized protein LOC123695211 n=1 Tax=Colias crocea TaxID=72248 RepID=UPI001E27D8E1|nr:uncharacterized protein LOC123695211 [Colias croceus]
MARTKSKKTREEKLVEAKLRRRKKYEEIKNDPEKYAVQKEKERLRYLKRKEQKQIKSAADMTPREKRLQRKKWKENTKRYIEKQKANRRIQQLLIDGTPPSSDREDTVDLINQQDPLEGTSREANSVINANCKLCQKKIYLIRKIRYVHKNEISKLKKEKEKVEKERDAIKRALRRITKKNQIRQDHHSQKNTQEKVDRLVETIDENKREEVKKKLLFSEIVSRNLSEGYNCLKKKEKRIFSDIVIRNRDKFKKHKILGMTSTFSVRPESQEQNIKCNKIDIKQLIEEFFQDDLNTKISPGKNEFITRNGVRKQKRYLNDTLINLYKKFIKNQKVGYSTFCKYRPFWVLQPKDSDRNTCACKIHVNFDLLVKSLNKNKIIEETNGTALLQSLCCDAYSESCLNRTCKVCQRRVLNYKEFNNDLKINYYEWCTKRENYETNGDEKIKIVNTKIRATDHPKNIIEKLENSSKSYFKHCANILVQYNHLKRSCSTYRFFGELLNSV